MTGTVATLLAILCLSLTGLIGILFLLNPTRGLALASHRLEQLPLVMSELVRVSRRFVLAAEYAAKKPTEVPYRGHSGALFKRDFGALYRELFPQLRQRRSGFLGRDQGFDDVTWWLFEKKA